MKTENETCARTRRKRTPREEIIAHLAWWWMGNLTPARYAKAHGLDPVVFERWILSRLIFRPECGGPKVRMPVKSDPRRDAVRTEFVGMTVAGEESPC